MMSSFLSGVSCFLSGLGPSPPVGVGAPPSWNARKDVRTYGGANGRFDGRTHIGMHGRTHTADPKSDQISQHMSGHLPVWCDSTRQKYMPEDMSEHMSDFRAGQSSEHMATRTLERTPIHSPASLTDARLDARTRAREPMRMSGSARQDSLSIHVPCLLPNRASGWGTLEVQYQYDHY